MAINRKAPVQALTDAAVEAAAGEDPEMRRRRERAFYQTPGERSKAKKDSQRNRKHIDMSETLEGLIDSLAAELDTSNSSVAVYLMIAGARHVTMTELNAAKRVTRSMRYEYRLEPPEIPRKIKD